MYFRWIAVKLVGHVPVFELEDTILKPFLHCVMEYLEEVIMEYIEEDADNKVVFLTIINSLLEHTERIVKHCGAQPEIGLGEIPSLPSLVPRILSRTFEFLNQGENVIDDSDLKVGINQCFTTSRSLLTELLTILDDIKIRTVLEDELELLVSLCNSLLGFHDILIPLDFKLTCMVWKLYLKLTTKHQVKLSNRLELSAATDKVSAELTKQYQKLRHLLLSPERDQNINKDVTKVAYLLKIVQTSAAQAVGKSASFLLLLLEVFMGLPDCPVWVPDVARKKLIGDILSPNIKHNMVKIASQEPFLSYMLNNVMEKAWSQTKQRETLQILVQLLLQRAGQGDRLFDLCLGLVSTGGLCLNDPDVEGRQVRGQGVVKVDTYSWLLTQLCSHVASQSPEEFIKIEKSMLKHLLSSSSSPLALLLISDIFSFLGRFSSSKMCLGYLTLFHEVKTKVSKQILSLNLTYIDILIERLTAFLTLSHKSQWTSLTTEKDTIQRVQPDDLWRRLSSGGYRPMPTSSSIKTISKLVEKTIMEAGSLTLEQMRNIVTDIMKLMMRNPDHDPVFVTQVLRVIQTFSTYHHGSSIGAHVMAELFKIWDKLGNGRSFIGKALIETSRNLGFQIPDNLRIEIKNEEPLRNEKCSCCGWDDKKLSSLMVVLDSLKHDDLLTRQPTLERTSSSESQSSVGVKKRKISVDLDSVDEVVTRIQADVEYLSRQNSDNLAKYKDELYEVKLKIEAVI